jgi:hypothetical protein
MYDSISFFKKIYIIKKCVLRYYMIMYVYLYVIIFFLKKVKGH